MGHLMPVDEARLVDVPTRKIVSADVIRSGEWVFIKYTKPQYAGYSEFSVCRIYTTEKWAFPLCINSWPWQKSFMDVLVRLGLMSKERREELIEIDRQRADRSQRKYDAERLEEISKRYGLAAVAKAAATINPTRDTAHKEEI